MDVEGQINLLFTLLVCGVVVDCVVVWLWFVWSCGGLCVGVVVVCVEVLLGLVWLCLCDGVVSDVGYGIVVTRFGGLVC